MNLRRLTITALLVMLSTAPAAAAQDVAQETETQRDARLAWWREARFGMFIHWGPTPCRPARTRASGSPASANGS